MTYMITLIRSDFCVWGTEEREERESHSSYSTILHITTISY